MYVSTRFQVGQTAYAYDSRKDSVTRGKIRAIFVQINQSGTETAYSVAGMLNDAADHFNASDSQLYSSAEAAFWANSLPVDEPEAEPSAADAPAEVAA